MTGPVKHATSQLTFAATAGKGRVSALLQQPVSFDACLVLAHGAGADMRHVHMQSIADALCEVNIATLRFNFPYMEAGGGRTNDIDVCTTTIRNAIACLKDNCDLRTGGAQPIPVLSGGHSFGGRMSSYFAADEPQGLSGLVYFSFPLHPAGKPGTSRADHMYRITLPQLFLSGTRDKLADLTLLRELIGKMQNASLHELDTADHGFKVLKRKRDKVLNVYTEAAESVRRWLDGLPKVISKLDL